MAKHSGAHLDLSAFSSPEVCHSTIFKTLGCMVFRLSSKILIGGHTYLAGYLHGGAPSNEALLLMHRN